jgi:3-dehydroquinate synthase
MAEKNCRIKYEVVQKDEKEVSGLREALNLGHTLGRAVETVSDYTLLHGEAVAIGRVFQARLGETLGFMKSEETARIIDLLKAAQLPVEIPETVDREKLFQKLFTDKKTRNGKLRFVFTRGIGQLAPGDEQAVSREVSEEEVLRVL